MNKMEEHALLDANSQRRIVRLDDVMNQKSIGNMMSKRNHVDAMTKSSPIQEVPGDAPVTIQCIPASQVTMKTTHLSCIPPNQTMGTEALKHHICTLPSAAHYQAW